MTTKPRVLLVLDGVAESTRVESQTTLGAGHAPFLNKLTRSLKVGLFDPHDRLRGKVSTDIIVGTLAGVRLDPWPGRAWLEAAALGISDHISYAAIIRPCDGSGERLGLRPDAIEALNNLQFPGVRFLQRQHERTACSWLLMVLDDFGDTHIRDTVEAIVRIATGLHQETVQMIPADVFTKSLMPSMSCRLRSAVLAHARGSLLGICRAGGIHGLDGRGSPLDMGLHATLFSEIRQLLTDSNYRNYILYIKALDWASHAGVRALKADWLRFIDKELVSFLFEHRSAMHITLVSDHRTNIGSSHAENDTSIFATTGGIGDDCPFVESEIENVWRACPLSLEDLSWVAFPPER